LIDFNRNTAFVIKMLDPRVGSEIEQLIDKLNNSEDEETFEDFLKQQSTLSRDGTDESNTDGNELTIVKDTDLVSLDK